MSESLLCVVAHPDDETMLTGGLLAMLAERGVAIRVLCATRGQGGEVGEPPVCTREDLGQVREAELRCAATALGVGSIEFLDYVDPPIDPDGQVRAFDADPGELEADVLKAITRLRPAALLTHGSGGEYGHPGHVLVHRTAVRAARRAGVPLYTFCAAIPDRKDRIFNTGDVAHIVLDVTPWLDAKEAAAMCHRTQHALFMRNHPHARSVREVLRAVESLHLAWSPDGDHAPILAVLLDGNGRD